MNKNGFFKRGSIWCILAGCSLACGCFTLYKGIDKMTNYHSDEIIALNQNAYVGGDAYNYIINGNYATAFFVLTTMFVLAAIGLMILHYVSKSKATPPAQVENKSVIDDIESNLPEI